MQLHTVYLCLETALHVSGVTSTHHQEHIQLYLQHLALVKPLQPPAAIVEEFELRCTSPVPSNDSVSGNWETKTHGGTN